MGWRFSSVIRHSAMRRFFKELMIVYQIVWFLRTTSSEDLSREDSYRKMLNEVKQKIKDWGCFVSLVHFNSKGTTLFVPFGIQDGNHNCSDYDLFNLLKLFRFFIKMRAG